MTSYTSTATLDLSHHISPSLLQYSSLVSLLPLLPMLWSSLHTVANMVFLKVKSQSGHSSLSAAHFVQSQVFYKEAVVPIATVSSDLFCLPPSVRNALPSPQAVTSVRPILSYLNMHILHPPKHLLSHALVFPTEFITNTETQVWSPELSRKFPGDADGLGSRNHTLCELLLQENLSSQILTVMCVRQTYLKL